MGIGTYQLGGEWGKTFSQEEVDRIIHTAEELEINQIHSPFDEESKNDELWEMLRGQVKAGKVRHLGISVSRQTGRESNEHQVECAPEVGVEVIQLMYNCLFRMPEERMLPFCRKSDLGVLARVPLASGVLTGKYPPETTFPEDDVRHPRV